MRIITQPSIHVLSIPMFFAHPRYQIPQGVHGTYAEELITHAGKGCFDSYGPEGRTIQEHIKNLIRSGHGSVLEHANISIFIEGISRGCSHELVRHRAGFAFSQRSTRYTAEEESAIVLDPFYADLYATKDLSINQKTILNQFIHDCKRDIDSYTTAVEWLMDVAPEEMTTVNRRKWARGKARQLLPHAIETRLTMTGNLRAWRHLIEIRSAVSAEAEIRRLAYAIFQAISPTAPFVFEDFVAVDGPDGIPRLSPKVSKV